ncbi:deoxyribodipyrimidine photo-lyase [Sporosarcina sp. NCCP-2222]|uniref:cryptochrome/photolyase family protein n=1 Tax=Sporosarcina sp. NCCP-2222 TaxID=2935073 RepID=UPI0020865275|nr:deoxyribodipyrimidine photo-lyase [Sporosarcina sp. NCCP-2222]GKV55156.1 deoxyribodipyrimidine photo-lyase [Sporosarcina sp. NCCP-2222]
MKTTIVWFRKDLRLHDHPALFEAASLGKVIPVFIWTPEDEKAFSESGPSLWWLHRSLQTFENRLNRLGVQLVIRKGESANVLAELAKETQADGIFFNERFEPAHRAKDEEAVDLLRLLDLDVQTFRGNLLFDPYVIKNSKGEPFKVFTAFWKKNLAELVPRPLHVPVLQRMEEKWSSLAIEELGFTIQRDWAECFESMWEPGEQGAIEKWEEFMDEPLLYYGTERDLFAGETAAVSMLSPAIAAGDISVRSIWHSAKRISDASVLPAVHQSVMSFLRQLAWRDFAYYQLVWFPKMVNEPLIAYFSQFPWSGTKEQLDQWKQGQTGYPLVDAGMRELLKTGVIHNRVRMVAASFLVKHLLIPWTEGSDWFRKSLVDYDIANNAMGWQWVAGTGIDAAPYFRIFNPVAQSEKFDANGDYIRKWVPELADLPAPHIHKPWDAPPALLREANVQLDLTYPRPIVDHSLARKRALRAYNELRKQG